MGNKVTRPKAAKAASKVLRDGRTGMASRTAAGSALSQVPKRGKKVKSPEVHSFDGEAFPAI